VQDLKWGNRRGKGELDEDGDKVIVEIGMEETKMEEIKTENGKMEKEQMEEGNNGAHMERVRFNELVLERCRKIQTTLIRKAFEYASGDNRFHNFDIAAMAKGETPEEALWGMYIKHWVSVQDMVKSGEVPNQKWVDEKIGDSINYHVLLEGLFNRKRVGGIGNLEKKEKVGEETGGGNRWGLEKL
jgi:hypothetical protein